MLGNFKAVKMLLETRKFDVNATDDESYTPLEWVVFSYFSAKSEEDICARTDAIQAFFREEHALKLRDTGDYTNNCITKSAIGGGMMISDHRVVKVIKQEYMDLGNEGRSSELHPDEGIVPSVGDQ
jgi:hypothetical protein